MTKAVASKQRVNENTYVGMNGIMAPPKIRFHLQQSVKLTYARLFICALWSPAGKGLTSWLSFVVFAVNLSLSHWYPGSGVLLDCIDS